MVIVNEAFSKSSSTLSNIRLHGITSSYFKRLLLDKLGLDHPIQRTSEAWARKLPDMKMLVALLFGEFLSPRHRYWGYCDMDMVWGNVSRFAHWFQGDFPVVKTNPSVHGPAQFFVNEERFIRLYLNEKYVNTTLYLSLLKNEMNYNLDEIGMWTGDRTNFRLSLHQVLEQYLADHHLRWNGAGAGVEELQFHDGPGLPQGFVFMDEDSALHQEWSTCPVLWDRGSLRLVGAMELYPAGREILIFHRPRKHLFDKKPSPELKQAIIDDMIVNGYLLPIWSPIVTRRAAEFEKIRVRDGSVQMRFNDRVCNHTGAHIDQDSNLRVALVAWKGLICAKVE